ncbi:MAG TPA: hypothetical protein VN620_09110 [Candidatus Methylomirabilis sp.]|nr:hypothetical protein [Candidatus Methylomirabilis sp.]
MQFQQDSVACGFSDQTKLLVSRFLAKHIAAGDELTFSIRTEHASRPEVLIIKARASDPTRHVYQAAIGHVCQPRQDKRNEYFVVAEVQRGSLGINSIFLPCGVLREYFYRMPRTNDRADHPTLYDTLRIPASASIAELRVAFKLRDLELKTAGVSRSQQAELERAFNIVGEPGLRACYDTLLADPEAPAIFPYGGFGSLLVAGEPSRDGHTFFTRRIVAFSPDLRRRRFRVPLRRCEFYDDRALCRDVRRKLEFWLDPAVLHVLWDRTWNQWKHLLGTKIEVEGTFVQTGKYRKRHGEWEHVTWETALPSRLEVNLPADFQQQVERARTTYHRIGQYSRALDQIRLRLEHRALERAELERMCSVLRLPGDFDVAQISWRADYDPFFYRQLLRRAHRIYLFRDEYIFDVEKAVVVETPQLGHATYVFAKPRNMDSFLALYTRITKDDIRRNRNNAAERLGFLGRVIHGTNQRAWLKEVGQRVGERLDFATSIRE